MKTMKLFIATIFAAGFAVSSSAFTQSPTSGNDELLPIETVDATPTEDVPQYPGGTKAMYDFLFKNMKFPSADKKKGINGIVVARFTVKKDGSLANVEVIKHGTPSMDKEVIRVIKKMPKWIPGKKNGVPVDVSMAIPVNFKNM